MNTEQQEFEGWTRVLPSGEFFRHRKIEGIGYGVSVVGFALLMIGLFVERDGQWVMPIWLKVSCPFSALAGMIVVAYGRHKTAAREKSCHKCGNPNRIVETLLNPGERHSHDNFVFGQSGRAYQRVRDARSLLVSVFEVRKQWLACENCRQYVSMTEDKQIYLGLGEDLVAQSEQRLEEFAAARKLITGRMERQAESGPAVARPFMPRSRSRKPVIVPGNRKTDADTE